MRILLAHNRYQHAGGEDAVFEAERELLLSRGHEVVSYERHNDEIRHTGLIDGLRLAGRTVWATDSSRDLRAIVRRERPEVAHFINTFPLISPAAYHVCRSANVPVVQTVGNYRLVCPAALLRRNGRSCEDCVGRAVPWPGVLHRCYRGSATASATVAAMLSVHRALGTFRNLVDLYLAPTAFLRQKLVEGGFPESRIVVRPNFVSDPGPRGSQGSYALFVGRLSEEKGIETLLRAFRRLPDIPLRIVGDGPLADRVRGAMAGGNLPRGELLGWRPRAEVFQLMKGARTLVFPSECYEGLPMTVVEAFACGLPVVASRVGAMQEIVEHDRTGVLFTPGDADALAGAVSRLDAMPAEVERMGREARLRYETHYAVGPAHDRLLDAYEQAARRSR
jgi:glycosyltransferase involved in cell wall biosynthesis